MNPQKELLWGLWENGFSGESEKTKDVLIPAGRGKSFIRVLRILGFRV